MAASVNLFDFKVDHTEETGSPRAQHWDTFVDDIMAAQITRRPSLDIFKGITCFGENYPPLNLSRTSTFAQGLKLRAPLSQLGACSKQRLLAVISLARAIKIIIMESTEESTEASTALAAVSPNVEERESPSRSSPHTSESTPDVSSRFLHGITSHPDTPSANGNTNPSSHRRSVVLALFHKRMLIPLPRKR